MQDALPWDLLEIELMGMIVWNVANHWFKIHRNEAEYTMSREKMLNREIIVPTIRKFCSVNYKKFTVSDLIHKSGHRHRVEIEADGLCFYVDFHFKENGSTSIDVSSGHHLDKKKQIKDVILSDPSCLLVGSEKKQDSD